MKGHIAIPGSERKPMRGAKASGAVDPKQRIQITLQVCRREPETFQRRLEELRTKPPQTRAYLTQEQFAAIGGADPEHIARIDEFAGRCGLTVIDASLTMRTVRLAGTAKAIGAALGVKLQKYKAGAMTYRGHTGPAYVPADLGGVVERVLGLDNRPVARPHYRLLGRRVRTYVDSATLAPKTVKAKTAKGIKPPVRKPPIKPPAAPRAAAVSYTPLQIADAYSFPAGLDGTGQTIALIELNDTDSQGNPSGAGFSTSDLNTYFKSIGLKTPSVTAVGVNGGANVPGQDSGADGEVTLDIEVAGAIAPGAKIAVYFGKNSSDGFVECVTTAIHDTARRPSVVSISWGGPEDSSVGQLMDGLNQALEDAVTLGVTVCVAAGDSGSADMDQQNFDGQPHVDFPAASPNALGCGGTALHISGSNIGSESVWNGGANDGATGGGVSNYFAKPSYQSNANVPKPASAKGGRGVPDVAGDADPSTGYQVLFDRQKQVVGGTSAVAPLWAGLIARINQRLAANGGKPVGFVNTELYAAANAFRDITQGNNDIYGDLGGKYPAGKGWDACTGLGSPDGAAILAALGGASANSGKKSK